MNGTSPKVWFSPDHPAGLVIEDSSGTLWRVPEMAAFDGDRSALQPIRSDGVPAFPGELFIDLVGVAEIAERAKVDAGTVHAWRSRHDDFPPPMASLRAGPVWTWGSIERWLKVKPPVGRPRRHDAVNLATPAPRSPVLKHLRGDGGTKTFRLRDRFELGSVQVEVDSQPALVDEDVDGRRFTLQAAPARGSDIKLRYRSILG